MDELRRVVVVGGTSDTETVLKAVFEPRGATVQRTRTATPPASTSESDVIVIDLDSEHDLDALSEQPYRVLIGSRFPKSITTGERFLEKPFQYPELVKAIEELLTVKPAV